MKPRKFDKILIANRGEIACRIMQAAKVLGIKTVAVYSVADKNALHVRTADEAIHIGEGPATESYLNVAKLLEAAKKTGAGAIHPGYGFLSEREHFAKAVLDAGLCWIGPSPEVIELMGNKVAAKLAAEKAKVPTLPWAQLKDGWKLDDLKKSAAKIGFPLLLKAAAGGGGRGMRLVEKESELEEKAQSAVREAQGAFGSGEMFLEKFSPRARHVEVQLFGDYAGNIMIFGERDCSYQRRHQKVIEESPAPSISQKARDILWSAARNLAKSVGYINAGTCEFLVDFEENVYFLEMNTRLQVEHPVSEMVWGVDLPVLQLKIAQGEAMSADVLNAKPRGHAIELRIYAEDPSKGFMPSPGEIREFEFPFSPGMRVDTGYYAGAEVPMFYDAMLAKVISWGTDRNEARIKLEHSLAKSKVVGVAWNGYFLADLLKDKTFLDGKVYTRYIDDAYAGWKGKVRTEASIQTNEDSSMPRTLTSPWNYYGSGKTNLKKAAKAHDAIDADDMGTQDKSGPIVSEHPGKVLKINVKPGDSVKKGQTVIVTESMKMEFAYQAYQDSKVKEVKVNVGDIIKGGTTLVTWDK